LLFSSLFSSTVLASQQKKGKLIILDFDEAWDGGGVMAVKSAGPYANHLHVAPDT